MCKIHNHFLIIVIVIYTENTIIRFAVDARDCSYSKILSKPCNSWRQRPQSCATPSIGTPHLQHMHARMQLIAMAAEKVVVVNSQAELKELQEFKGCVLILREPCIQL